MLSLILSVIVQTKQKNFKFVPRYTLHNYINFVEKTKDPLSNQNKFNYIQNKRLAELEIKKVKITKIELLGFLLFLD